MKRFNSNCRITHLNKNIKYDFIIKRNVTSYFSLVNQAAKLKFLQPLPINTSATQHVRTFASAHGGRITLPKKNIPKVTASSDDTEAVNSEMNYHSVAVLAVCKSSGCKHTNCAEGNTETNPCKVSGEAHQGPLFTQELNDAGIVVEINGALTHKIPTGCEGTFLSHTDINGSDKDQHVMHEKGVIPVEKPHFEENEKKTEYLQQNKITNALIKNASKDSVVNSNNKEPSTFLSKNNTPLDENF